MIAAWMLYCVGIGLAFVVAGQAIEWALRLAGRQTRWAWCVALAGSLLVPAAAWLVPDAFRTLSVPMPERITLQPFGDGGAATTEIAVTGASRRLAPSDLDRPLALSWVLASTVLLGALATAALRLAVLRRRWRATIVDGRRVLVSENVGPAVAGVWDPRIVIPGWALQLSEQQRMLMLTHEEEHLLAGDPRLLAYSRVALLVAPWNPALWWQVRRLRLAVEMDCDARVLGRGHQGPAYGELLLQVGQRRARLPLGAPALGEPVSFLERRIRRMAGALPRWRWLGTGAAAVIAAGAIIGACEAPRPVNPEQAGDPAAEAGRTPESSGYLVVQGPSTLERVPPRGVPIRWMRAAITQTYAEYLTTPANPPVDLWFHGTTGGRVVQSTRTVGRRVARLRYGDIEAHLPELRPSRPGVWFAWAYPLGPGREDVRAIWADDGGDSEAVTPRGQGQAPPGLTRSVVDGREVLSGPRIQYEGPALLSGPPLQYPELLRHAGIEGRVIVQAIIDTTGRAEPASVKVIESPNPGFDQAAINWVRRALFRPARVNGQAVRALMKMPIEFK
jgi:TonB family protein